MTAQETKTSRLFPDQKLKSLSPRKIAMSQIFADLTPEAKTSSHLGLLQWRMGYRRREMADARCHLLERLMHRHLCRLQAGTRHRFPAAVGDACGDRVGLRACEGAGGIPEDCRWR
jgi:hypothetical protein